MAQGNRMQRVANLVQTTLADILQQNSDYREYGMITVTHVSLSRDFSSAKVFVSVLEESKAKAAVAALNGASREIRYDLAQSKLEMRVIPQLHFVYDDSTVRGSHISALINSALKNSDK